jgi:hypothetical protein
MPKADSISVGEWNDWLMSWVNQITYEIYKIKDVAEKHKCLYTHVASNLLNCVQENCLS